MSSINPKVCCRSQDLDVWPAQHRGSTLGPGLKLLYTAYLSWQKTITEICRFKRFKQACFPMFSSACWSTVSLFSNLFRLLGWSPRFHSGVLSAPFSRSLELRGPVITVRHAGRSHFDWSTYVHILLLLFLHSWTLLGAVAFGPGSGLLLQPSLAAQFVDVFAERGGRRRISEPVPELQRSECSWPKNSPLFAPNWGPGLIELAVWIFLGGISGSRGINLAGSSLPCDLVRGSPRSTELLCMSGHSSETLGPLVIQMLSFACEVLWHIMTYYDYASAYAWKWMVMFMMFVFFGHLNKCAHDQFSGPVGAQIL